MRWSDKPVYLCCGCTGMRKSINGLMTLVQDSFSLDPFADALFVCCNRSRDRIKILEWDGNGFWLYFKRLERGRFRWRHLRKNYFKLLRVVSFQILLPIFILA